MKRHFAFLIFTYLTTIVGIAQASNDSREARKILQHQGYTVISLLNSSAEEIVNALTEVGIQQVLEQSPRYFKLAFSGSVSTDRNSTTVFGNRQQRRLSEFTQQDLRDASIAVNPEVLSRNFTYLAIKCIDTSGQGMERIIWCGLKKY
jgi:methionine-rich copper-binding protein CopC